METKEGKLMKQSRTLSTGITDEAMAVLEEVAHMELPVFQFRDAEGAPLGGDAATVALHAAIRDGEQGLVKKIRQMRALARKE